MSYYKILFKYFFLIHTEFFQILLHSKHHNAITNIFERFIVIPQLNNSIMKFLFYSVCHLYNYANLIAQLRSHLCQIQSTHLFKVYTLRLCNKIFSERGKICFEHQLGQCKKTICTVNYPFLKKNIMCTSNYVHNGIIHVTTCIQCLIN